MFRGIFQTKERKKVAAILALSILVVGIFVIKNITEGELFVEQAVMAENYLEAGDYEKAVEAYLEALSTKDSDLESLSIGLADAYIGLNDYDKALEVLNSCYQKTTGIEIKEKIEEVMSVKTDYEYLQSVSRAEVYYSNEEYDKAITGFEQAKLINSKAVTAYQRIAEAYIAMGNYDKAREEVLEGQEFTQSEELVDTLVLVDSFLLKDEYDTIVAEAEEYICQENYGDGIKTYQKAIELLPQESGAYRGLAEAYVAQKNYQKAILLLQEAVEKVNDNELESLLTEITQQKEDEEEKRRIISELSEAMKTRDIELVYATMNSDFFKEKVASEAPEYYGLDKEDISRGYGLIVYDSEKVYYGDIRDRVRSGAGIYFVLPENEEETGYYYFEGKWSLDLPHGTGKTVEIKVMKNDKGESYGNKTVTEGNFNNAVENGTMTKHFYTNEEETGKVSYVAKNGIPMPMKGMDNLQYLVQNNVSYAIGKLYLDGAPTGEEYVVEPYTLWGVKTFISAQR